MDKKFNILIKGANSLVTMKPKDQQDVAKFEAWVRSSDRFFSFEDASGWVILDKADIAKVVVLEEQSIITP